MDHWILENEIEGSKNNTIDKTDDDKRSVHGSVGMFANL